MSSTPAAPHDISSIFKKTFESCDSDWFSGLSGDLNPLHRDVAYAKLTPWGKPVVHGMAAVLGALGAWAGTIASVPVPVAFRSLRIQFRKPIFWGLELELRTSATEDRKIFLEWIRGESVYLKVECRVSESGAEPIFSSIASCFPRSSARTATAAESWEKSSNTTDFRYSIASKMLGDPQSPFHGQSIAVRQIQVLAWASYFVGMEWPGASALFLDCSFEFTGFSWTSSPAPFALESLKSTFDPRFRVWNLKGVSQDAVFTIRSVDRPEPVSYSRELLVRNIPTERSFREKTVLITGGSRGFGSLLCEGFNHLGATVWYTSRSESSAENKKAQSPSNRIVGDMSEALSCNEMGKQLCAANAELDGVILNASPSIVPVDWAEGRDRDSLSFIAETAAMVLYPLRAVIPRLKKSGFIVYISSEYVKKPVRYFSHYIAAKSAAEGLIRALSLEFPAYSFVIVRPPKILTNQTNMAYDPNPPAKAEIIAGQLLSELCSYDFTNAGGGVAEMDLIQPLLDD